MKPLATSTPAGGLTVRVLEEPGLLAEAEWDALVAQADAPVFYRHRFLTAYGQSGLHSSEASAMLVVRDAGGRTIAGIPVYLLNRVDPVQALGPVLARHGRGPSRMLLSHCWHCYDTTLVSSSDDPAVLAALCDGLRSLAREWDADGYGLVNVAAARRPGLDAGLRGLGFVADPIDIRYSRSLASASLESLLASLSHGARHTMRRYRRRAREAGLETEVLEAPLPALDEFLDLCQLSAAKHGNSSYYPRDAIGTLVRRLEPFVRLVRLRDRLGRTLAGSICFLDGPRFHSWAGGARNELARSFSPNYLLFLAEFEAALRCGCDTFEAGRRSGEFKLRHGMAPVELVSYLGFLD